ncbi:hypothetical protein [Streptomyces sp. NPDC050738]|uniref:hypothetical protein n=1 Tax=Streptomyces sp. NPDC050738 TaxID=3154744 RepID=UPI00343C29C7
MYQQGSDKNPQEKRAQGQAAIPGTVLADDLARAAERLQKQFPGIVIEGKLSTQDDAFWTSGVRHGGTPLSVDDLLSSLLGLLSHEQCVGLRVQFFTEGTVPEGEPRAGLSKGVRLIINAKVPLSAADELKRPFSLNQVYKPGATGPVLHIEAVVAPQHGRQATQLLFAHAQHIGVSRLTLCASMIAGSQEGVFAWARYGFVPLQKDWDDMRRAGLEKLDSDPVDLRAHNAELRGIVLDPAPKALRRLVYCSWQRKGATVAFLNAMLTAHVSWQGELDLTDTDGCTWLQTYARLARASDHLAQFTPLLPAPSTHPAAPPQIPQVQPPVGADASDEDDSPFGFSEAEEVEALVGQISAGLATFEEVEKEYGDKQRPEVIRKVREALAK